MVRDHVAVSEDFCRFGHTIGPLLPDRAVLQEHECRPAEAIDGHLGQKALVSDSASRFRVV